VTRDELRAGLVRLGLVVALGVIAVVGAGFALWGLGGGSLSRAVALTFAVASSLLVLAGAAAGVTVGPVSMDRKGGRRERRYRSKEERRERELLALGLIVAGVACFAVSVTLG
jgi:hypothetical protein